MKVVFSQNTNEYLGVLCNIGDQPICVREINLFYCTSKFKYQISKLMLRFSFVEKIILFISKKIIKKPILYPERLHGVTSLSEIYFMPVAWEGNHVSDTLTVMPHSIERIKIDIESIRRKIGHSFNGPELPEDKIVKCTVIDVQGKCFTETTQYTPYSLYQEIIEIQQKNATVSIDKTPNSANTCVK